MLVVIEDSNYPIVDFPKREVEYTDFYIQSPLYSVVTKDALVPSELKDELKQLDQQITDVDKIHDPIYYICATILGVSAISGFATGLPLFFADYKKKLENAVDNKEENQNTLNK